MPKTHNRSQRVAELIQTALADILRKEADELKLGMVTITGVTISADLSFAKIFVSVLDDNKAKEIIAKLNHSVKNIRYQLAHSVQLRIAPALKFIYDDSSLRGHHISELINKAIKNDNNSAQ